MSRKLKEKKDIYIQEEIPPENLIPEENILSLRKKEWVIRIDPKQIKDFLYLHKHTLIFIFTFFTACAFIISTSSTNASVTTFYPGTCLGGWQNVENATGEPSVEDPERKESFTKENSAVFENSNEEIFCGDFKGLIPEDSEPKRFVLSFNWSYDYGEIKHDDPLISGQEIEIKQGDLSDDGNEKETQEEVTEDPIKESKEETIKLDEVKEEPAIENINENKAEETTSFLRNIFSIAHAQEEVSPEPEPSSPEPEPEPEPEPAPVVESEPEIVSDIQTKENSIEEPVSSEEVVSDQPTNDTGSSQGGGSTSEDNEEEVLNVNNEEGESKEEEIETSPNDIFEVVYTLDGETWDVLGRVRKDKWQESSFEIPYEKITSWDDLSKLQIRLKVLPSFDSMPIVYLDAISLDVEYADLNVEIETIDFNDIVHTVESPDMFVFLAKKENKYGIWVLDKKLIGKPEENLLKLETVGVLPFEPVVKDRIIFWVVGDPQTPVEEVVSEIVPDSVDEYLNSDPAVESIISTTEEAEIIDENTVTQEELVDSNINTETEEEVVLPIDTIDSLEESEIVDDQITEVFDGQKPTAIVGFREDIGYISQTILNISNKENWLNFEEYAVAWQNGSFLIFDKINSITTVFDSLYVNKSTPNVLPKTFREWIVHIPEFDEKEDEVEVYDSEDSVNSSSSQDLNEGDILENKDTSDSEETGITENDEIEVINVDVVDGEEKTVEKIESVENNIEQENTVSEISL